MGAPSDSYLGRFHGALWVLLMGRDGEVAKAVEISDATGVLPRMGEWGNLGTAIAPLGDLDGDGTPDLAVGAPGYDGDAEDSGDVWVLYLDPSGDPKRSVDLGKQKAVLAAGIQAEFGLGAALANLGDLDGDGFPELAVAQRPVFDRAVRGEAQVLIVSLDKDAEARWVRPIHLKEIAARANPPRWILLLPVSETWTEIMSPSLSSVFPGTTTAASDAVRPASPC